VAVKPFTVRTLCSKGDHVVVFTWEPISAGDEGAPVEMPGSYDRTVQVTGTFAGPDRVQLQGSLNGTDYNVLTDRHGATISFRAPGLTSVEETVAYMKPKVTAGAPTAVVMLLVRRPSRA
jgi:hypothetical protein